VDKRRASTFLSARVFNPLVLAAARAGLPTPSVVILETTGRRSGMPRRVPVTRMLDGDTLWIVTEHGRRAAYVLNIEANPRVRVRVGRRWRPGYRSRPVRRRLAPASAADAEQDQLSGGSPDGD
jgi:deazaflavin-dependent oxidoreductase (nitroreductase family)